MRLSNAAYLNALHNALTERLRKGEAVGEDQLILAGVGALAARTRSGVQAVERIRDDLIELAVRIEAACPGAVANHAARLARLTDPPLASGMDPSVYVCDALALVSDIARELGEPGVIDASYLAILAEMAAWEERALRPPSPAPSSGAADIDAPFTPAEVDRFLASASPGGEDLKVVAFDEISGGMSKQAFRLTLRTAHRGDQEVIIKRSNGDRSAPIDCMQIHREFAVLEAVNGAGLPAPRPLWLSSGGAAAKGDFYVMARSRGACTTSFLATATPVSETVLLQMAEQMARLHTTSLDRLGEAPAEMGVTPDSTAAGMVAERLEAWRQLWLGFDRAPSAIEDFLFSWLKANIPPNVSRPVLVHGDFTPHNCLWEGDELTAVLDWECAHFGDPAEDLAYIKPHIQDRFDWRRFIDHYVGCGGSQVCDRTLAYFSCYSNFRSVLLANVYVKDVSPRSADLRPLLVDTAFSNMFIDECMNAARAFDAAA